MFWSLKKLVIKAIRYGWKLQKLLQTTFSVVEAQFEVSREASPIFLAEVSEVKFFPRCWKRHWTVLADTSHQWLRNDRLEWLFPFSQLSGYHTAQPPWGSFFQGAIEERLQLTVKPQIQEERCRVYPGRRTEDRVIGEVMKFSPFSVLIQYFVERVYNRVLLGLLREHAAIPYITGVRVVPVFSAGSK